MLTGVDAVSVYASTLVGGDHMTGAISALILGVDNVVSTFIASTFVTRIPRKILLLTGALNCSIINALISLSFRFNWHSNIRLGLLCVFLFVYACGPEPGVVMAFGEAFPAAHRGRLCGVGYGAYWVANIATVFALKASGEEWAVFAAFAVATATTGIVGATLIPETRGRTLAEIERTVRSWTANRRRRAK